MTVYDAAGNLLELVQVICSSLRVPRHLGCFERDRDGESLPAPHTLLNNHSITTEDDSKIMLHEHKRTYVSEYEQGACLMEGLCITRNHPSRLSSRRDGIKDSLLSNAVVHSNWFSFLLTNSLKASH
jgi:hypothetical protein